jgi:hypothetical protein
MKHAAQGNHLNPTPHPKCQFLGKIDAVFLDDQFPVRAIY